MHEIALVFVQFLWSLKSIFSGSNKKLSLVFLQVTNYIYSPWKKVKKNVKWLNLFWYKIFVQWKLKLPYLFDYKPISAISRDPKLWTCRLGITRTKNKSKTPSYKPRPIHYYKTELLTMGKPNIFGKKSHWL